MSDHKIEYNHEHAELERLLKSIDRPGDYFVAGRVEGWMPRMRVRPLGTIAFPILDDQVRSLLDAAQRAPYGRGPRTVLDTSVRDCWQIGARRVQLSGAGWEKTFRSILDAVAEGLGCDRGRLSARLYKLLVYEPEGFFSEHRDTEKVNGMIGTLVVALPTAGEGGELVIRHKGREETVNMHVAEPSELAYAAFYADCIHLTKPVKQGHRVCLVYNLIIKAGSRSTLPGPPDFSGQAARIEGILSKWVKSRQSPKKIVWMLDHGYSTAGLSISALKGLDETVGETLARAADRSGCVFQSATLSIFETGEPWMKDGFEYGREIDYTGREAELEEIWDWSYTLQSWSAPDLTGSALPEIPLLDEEVLPVGSLDDAEPDEQTFFEASGNEGISLERSYRLAAFVLWPRNREASVISDASIGAGVQYVERALATGATSREAEVTGAEQVTELIDSWPQDRRLHFSTEFRGREDGSLPRMLRLLSRIADDELSARFLSEVVVKQYGPRMDEALVPFLRKAKPSTLARFFTEFMRYNVPLCPSEALSLVAQLRKSNLDRDKPEWQDILLMAMHAAMEALPEALAPKLPEGMPEWRRPKPKALDAAAVQELFAGSHGLGLEIDLEGTAALLARFPEQVDPYRTIPAALRQLRRTVAGLSETRAYKSLWEHSTHRLLKRSATPPPQPKDERIKTPTGCGCQACKELKAFCLDRRAKTKRFKAVQQVRSHIEFTIKRAGLDIDFQTERRGRPYTLVCEKVPKSYRRRMEIYDEDVKHMQLLAAASPPGDSPRMAREIARLSKAVGWK